MSDRTSANPLGSNDSRTVVGWFEEAPETRACGAERRRTEDGGGVHGGGGTDAAAGGGAVLQERSRGEERRSGVRRKDQNATVEKDGWVGHFKFHATRRATRGAPRRESMRRPRGTP